MNWRRSLSHLSLSPVLISLFICICGFLRAEIAEQLNKHDSNSQLNLRSSSLLRREKLENFHYIKFNLIKSKSTYLRFIEIIVLTLPLVLSASSAIFSGHSKFAFFWFILSLRWTHHTQIEPVHTICTCDKATFLAVNLFSILFQPDPVVESTLFFLRIHVSTSATYTIRDSILDVRVIGSWHVMWLSRFMWLNLFFRST